MYYYREYNPDIRLAPWVKNYWTAVDFVDSEVAPKVFPDGCVDIIFMFDRVKGTSYAGLFGTMTTFVEVDFSESTQMFGIRFKPAGITAFTRVAVDEFTDWSVELALVETLFNQSFCDALPEKQSMAEVIAHTDNFLLSLLPCLYRPDRSIIHAVDLICFAKGQLSPAKVASDVCLSQRQFERKFKSVIGINPKTFAKIIRFTNTLRCLRANPRQDLLSIALHCGYYDHTHLIKDFKTFSGNAPTDLRY